MAHPRQARLRHGTLRPPPVGPVLLAVQDRAKRERFLEEWRRSVAPLSG